MNYLKVILNDLVRVHVPSAKAPYNRTQTYSSGLNGQNKQIPILPSFEKLCPFIKMSPKLNFSEWKHRAGPPMEHLAFRVSSSGFFHFSNVRKGKSLLERQLMH